MIDYKNQIIGCWNVFSCQSKDYMQLAFILKTWKKILPQLWKQNGNC